MKKLIFVLTAMVLLIGCTPKPVKVEVKTTTTTVAKVDTAAIERAQNTAKSFLTQIEKMIEETKNLVYLSKKIGKSDFTSSLAATTLKLDNFKQLVSNGKYEDSNKLAGIILAELGNIQTAIADASQSGKRK